MRTLFTLGNIGNNLGRNPLIHKNPLPLTFAESLGKKVDETQNKSSIPNQEFHPLCIGQIKRCIPISSTCLVLEQAKKLHLLGFATYGTTKYGCMHACMDECMNIKHYMHHIILMSHMCNNVILMSHACYVILMSHVYYIHLHESCFMVITFIKNIKKLFESSWEEILKHIVGKLFSGKTCFYIRKISFLKFFSWKKKFFKKLEKSCHKNK